MQLLNKAMYTNVRLNKATFILVTFSLVLMMFWVYMNSFIGAYLVTILFDDVIQDFKDIINDPNMIPTVRRSSAVEYIVKV